VTPAPSKARWCGSTGITFDAEAPSQNRSWVTAPEPRDRTEAVVVTGLRANFAARSAQSLGPPSGTGEKTYVSGLLADASIPWVVRCQLTDFGPARTHVWLSDCTTSVSLSTLSPTERRVPCASLTLVAAASAMGNVPAGAHTGTNGLP
jgi:hypothetical protein